MTIFGHKVHNTWVYLFTVRIVETRSELRENCRALQQYIWMFSPLLFWALFIWIKVRVRLTLIKIKYMISEIAISIIRCSFESFLRSRVMREFNDYICRWSCLNSVHVLFCLALIMIWVLLWLCDNVKLMCYLTMWK